MRALVFFSLICLTHAAFGAERQPSSAGRLFVMTCFQQECFKSYLLSSAKRPDGEATASVKTVFYFNPGYKGMERQYPYDPKPNKRDTLNLLCKTPGGFVKYSNGQTVTDPDRNVSHATIDANHLWLAVCKGQYPRPGHESDF
jgi:hypothetical protein